MKMKTFKAYFHKEVIESIRQYRYIILGFGILMFAIATPIMLKILPKLLEGELNADLSALIVFTKSSGVQSYIKDLFQISNMFIIFIGAGLLTDEISSQKLVFPYSKGGSPVGIVLAKFIHFSLVVCSFVFIGFMINYYYLGILVSEGDIEFSKVLMSALIMCIYFLGNIALTLFLGTIFKKGITAGIIVLLLSYFSSLIVNVKVVGELISYNLINIASSFDYSNIAKTIIIVVLISIILIVLTIYRMNKLEVI